MILFCLCFFFWGGCDLAASLPILFIDGPKFHRLHIWYALFPGAAGCVLLCLIVSILMSHLKKKSLGWCIFIDFILFLSFFLNFYVLKVSDFARGFRFDQNGEIGNGVWMFFKGLIFLVARAENYVSMKIYHPLVLSEPIETTRKMLINRWLFTRRHQSLPIHRKPQGTVDFECTCLCVGTKK